MKFLIIILSFIISSESEFLGPSQVCLRPGAYIKDRNEICRCPREGSLYTCSKMTSCKENQTKIINSYDDDFRSWMRRRINMEPEKCTPGSLYYYYCNTCVCPRNGSRYICTEKNCDITIWNKNGSLKTDSSVLVAGFRKICSPKSKVDVYCNKCRCSEDGSLFSCSHYVCEGLWNLNGTHIPTPKPAIIQKPPDKCQKLEHLNDFFFQGRSSVSGSSSSQTAPAPEENQVVLVAVIKAVLIILAIRQLASIYH